MRVTVKGPDFRAAITKLESIADDKVEEVMFEIKDAADQIVLLAKQASPINESRLRNSISSKEITQFQYEIVAQTKYAAFMEFGTRTLVSIPPGAEEIAAEARSIKGGTIKEMEASIRRWIRLKGLAGTYSVKTRKRTGSKAIRKKQDDQLVFLIMRKLLRVGVKPHPFFFPSIMKVTPGLTKSITKIITR